MSSSLVWQLHNFLNQRFPSWATPSLFITKKSFYWHFESYLTCLEWKKTSYFWTKLGNSGHSELCFAATRWNNKKINWGWSSKHTWTYLKRGSCLIVRKTNIILLLSDIYKIPFKLLRSSTTSVLVFGCWPIWHKMKIK